MNTIDARPMTTTRRRPGTTTRAALILSTALLLGLGSSPSWAVPSDDLSPHDASSEVASAVTDAGAPASTGAAGVKDTAAGVSTVLPGTSTSMVLPGADVEGATTTTTLVSGAGASQAAVQEVGEDGKRVAFIVNGASDPTAYVLNFAGASSLQKAEDGSVLVVNGSGGVDAVMAKPWAKDSNGADVPTHYEIDGTRLTQIVEHRNAGVSYPVTADPWARHWWGASFYFNRSQTNNIMLGSTGAAVAAMFIPEPTVSKALAAALGIFTGYANWAYNRGACLAVNRAHTGAVWAWHYYGGSCR